ncbi:MAG: Nre family DNA repair protein [Candidatus Micrarchaeia archaeon]
MTKNFKFKKVTRVEINSALLNFTKFIPKVESNFIESSSPPEVFVGRIGYPKVYAGPVLPLEKGDTSIYAQSEKWFGKSLEEIAKLRLSLIRTKKKLNVLKKEKFLEDLQEITLSKSSVDTEAKLKNKPKGYLLSEDSQPFGPSAIIEELKANPGSSEKRLEKFYYANDVKANEAIFELWKSKLEFSKMQQALSLGMLGIERKIVPTRWSITAIDSNLSLKLIEEIKKFETINEYRVYSLKYLDNVWVIILLPELWSYESLEAWYPGTIFNEEIAIGSDYEPFEGIKHYASIGGCYYSARLAIAEKLYGERKQAAAIVFREIHNGYLMPVGVWNVREAVRNALKTKPMLFSSFEESLNFASSILSIPLKVWVKYSKILKEKSFQKRLINF